jgi:hypothetical protein
MKRYMKSILALGAMVVGANGLLAGQASTNWVDQLYKAKLGRAPFAEARQRTEAANTVYREESPQAPKLANTWFEDFYRAKYGRNSPTGEARVRAERQNTVYREETVPAAVKPANTWRDDFYKAKLGRTLASE